MASSALIWNRLEPQPKTTDLSVALRCEVRDALWMLARQWQMGEFRAEDAGACAFVKVQCESVFAQKLSLRGAEPRTCSPETPLNFLTEGIAPARNSFARRRRTARAVAGFARRIGPVLAAALESQITSGKSHRHD